MSPTRRRLLWIGIPAAVLVLLAVAGRVLGGSPSGPAASSYSTRPGGVAAYAELLARGGARVERLRSPLAAAELDPRATVFVLGSPGLTDPAIERLRRFLERGGRLVFSPAVAPAQTLAGLLGDGIPDWTPSRLRPSAPLAEARDLRAVQRVSSGARGAWTSRAGSTPVLAPDRGGYLLLERRVGRGTVELLATTGPLANAHLARDDNAAFGVLLAGGHHDLVFAEGIHGYAAASGLAALPTRFRVAFALLALAAALLVLARFRRLGPPELPARPLPPPRREYVESLGRSLALTRDRTAALEPMRLAARTRLATLGGVAAEDEALRQTARQLGFEREVGALLSPASDDASALALARVAAKIARQGREARGARVNELRDRVLGEVRKAVVGQDAVVEQLLVAAVVGGHVLLEGAPGLAKTLLANATARALALDFRRVQFTPDMLPSDLTGTVALRAGELSFRPGPVFANVVLADEINRTPPKTQSALLEAMQERQVTVDGTSHPLPRPFLVVATQNPIEYEGTYPLPEAQLDRFLFKVVVDYPGERDERAMLDLPRHGLVSASLDAIQRVVGADELEHEAQRVDAVTVSDEVAEYVLAIVRRTRSLPSVELGASPRAAVHLLTAARAAARLAGRAFATPDDVVAMALPVLRHRLVLRPEAELERYGAADAIQAAVASVPVPR